MGQQVLPRVGRDLIPGMIDPPMWPYFSMAPVWGGGSALQVSDPRTVTIVSPAISVRYSHDLYFTLETRPNAVAISTSWKLNIQFTFDYAPRIGTDAIGNDIPPDDEDPSWVSSLDNPPLIGYDGTLTAQEAVPPGHFSRKFYAPVLSARSLYDDVGVRDFIRVRVTAATGSAYSGDVGLEAILWRNHEFAIEEYPDHWKTNPNSLAELVYSMPQHEEPVV